jgi:hypothetical protein
MIAVEPTQKRRIRQFRKRQTTFAQRCTDRISQCGFTALQRTHDQRGRLWPQAKQRQHPRKQRK